MSVIFDFGSTSSVGTVIFQTPFSRRIWYP